MKGVFLLKLTKNALGLKGASNLYKFWKQRGKVAQISYVPSKFSFTITNRCNLRCPTCQYILKKPSLFKDSGFMDINDYQNILAKYHKYMTHITLTGGESTLHPDFGEFIDISESFGLKVAIITNGILIKEKISSVQKLRDLSITLDAYDYESFSRNRGGTEKQWNRLIESLNALSEGKIKFKISFLATSKNIDDLPNMIEFADQYKPDTLKFNSFNPHGGDNDLVLSKSDMHVMDVISKILERKDYAYNIVLPNVFDDKHSPYFQSKICMYPWHGVYLNEKCNIAYCCQLPHDPSIGNISANYNFNSRKMISWREMLMRRKLPVDCKYCHRRFRGDYTKFIASLKRWKIKYPLTMPSG
ncbi:MAG: radical SAM protein [Desulfobacterales bacterium]